MLKQIAVRRRETFDSGATPKPGETVRAPRGRAKIDLESLGEQIRATVEKAKADDPRELRRRIAELERQLRERPAAEPVRIEVPVLNNGQLSRLESAVSGVAAVGKTLMEFAETLRVDIQRAANNPGQAVRPASPVPTPPLRRPSRPAPAPDSGAGAETRISGSQQRILDALAWLESLRIHEADKTQVALLADQSPTSGGYFNNLGSLRTAGLIDYPRASVVALTDAGRGRANPASVPQTSQELQDQLCRKLSGSQAAIIRHLASIYPADIAKDALAEAIGQSPTSGGYFNNLGRLRSLGVIDYPAPGRVVALPVLFLAAA